MAALSDMGFWRHIRVPRIDAPQPETVIPPGTGPLVIISGRADIVPGLVQTLQRRRRDLRVGLIGPANAAGPGQPAIPVILPEPPSDSALARRLVERLRPAAIVLVDSTLPSALIAAADEAGIPVSLVTPRIPAEVATARSAWRGGRRGPVARLARVMVPDRATMDHALSLGLAPARVRMVGDMAPVAPPLRGNAFEAAALRPALQSRHVWLAAALPLSEAAAILDAQRELLAVHHRALLIIAPAHPETADAIADMADARGLAIAQREREEEPSSDTQLFLAGDCSELGLWYRLSAVAWAGGTLSGVDAAAQRHPFEAASLGSAIIHGPRMGAYPTAWAALDDAGAARRILTARSLIQAAEELTAPDQAARLACAAWKVATAGADTLNRIADAILADLSERAA